MGKKKISEVLIQAKYEAFEKYLNDNKADYEEIIIEGNMVAVKVIWGDWKHSHIRLDALMAKINWVLIAEDTLESDGSDAYSSVHIYMFKGKK